MTREINLGVRVYHPVLRATGTCILVVNIGAYSYAGVAWDGQRKQGYESIAFRDLKVID